MTKLVPNLHELISFLDPDSDAALVSAVYDVDELGEADKALRNLVSTWESSDAHGDETE